MLPSSSVASCVPDDHFTKAYTTIGLLHDGKSPAGVASFAPTADAIRGLGTLAKSRNPEAIGLLFNLAWNTETSPKNAKLAIAELLNAYGESDADVQALIREQAWSLFDVVVRAPEAPQSGDLGRNLSLTLGTSLPTEVLYLAGLHADHADHRERLAHDKTDIESRLKVRLQPAKDAARDHNQEIANPLGRGRFTTQSELIAVHRGRPNLPVHRSQLDSAMPGNTAAILEDLKKSIPHPGDARTVFIKVGSVGREHWVIAVLVRAERHDRFQCLLFDSLYKPPLDEGYSGEAIELLGRPLDLTKILVVGDEQLQQGAPNSCGVYATLAADLLDKFRANRADTSIEQMARHLNSAVDHWKSLGDDRRDGMITAERARMLATWAEAAHKPD